MRKHVFFLPALFCISAKAQLPFKISNDISPVLSKVIHDYSNNFSHITGDTLGTDPQVINFACTLTIKGMEPGIITQYGDGNDHVLSWKNTLLETDDYEEAKKKFHLFYGEIKRTGSMINNTAVKLVGDYEEPDEAKKFTSILFKVRASDDHIKDLVVDLSLQYEMSSWKITVSIYRLQEEQMLDASVAAHE